MWMPKRIAITFWVAACIIAFGVTALMIAH